MNKSPMNINVQSCVMYMNVQSLTQWSLMFRPPISTLLHYHGWLNRYKLRNACFRLHYPQTPVEVLET